MDEATDFVTLLACMYIYEGFRSDPDPDDSSSHSTAALVILVDLSNLRRVFPLIKVLFS